MSLLLASLSELDTVEKCHAALWEYDARLLHMRDLFLSALQRAHVEGVKSRFMRDRLTFEKKDGSLISPDVSIERDRLRLVEKEIEAGRRSFGDWVKTLSNLEMSQKPSLQDTVTLTSRRTLDPNISRAMRALREDGDGRATRVSSFRDEKSQKVLKKVEFEESSFDESCSEAGQGGGGSIIIPDDIFDPPKPNNEACSQQ